MFFTLAELIIAYVAFYPLATAAFWIAGGITYRVIGGPLYSDVLDEGEDLLPISILVSAYNEAAVIGDAIRAALAVDYPQFELIVLDDGSEDRTTEIALAAAQGDKRLRVVRSDVNGGKATRLNEGCQLAKYPLIMVIDADARLDPGALKALATRMTRSPRIAAVAGDPRVANRGSLLAKLQALEFSSIIGLMRRTQALGGSVGTVAGIIGLFKKDAVLSVGGYSPHMATEDIDLTYRLLLAGWDTDYEPRALVGMTVPSTMGALWRQRKRWARGQGEVLRLRLRHMLSLRRAYLWPIAGESICSLLWINLSFIVVVILVIDAVFGTPISTHGLALAWGIAVAVVSVIQIIVALLLDRRYDHSILLAFAFGPLYPAAYWLLNAVAAVASENIALLRGPRSEVIHWNTPREQPK